MLNLIKNTVCFVGLLLLPCFILSAQSIPNKPRTVVTTDGEVDDQDSFIRMLLYANEFELLGLVYSSSQWHYTGDGKGTKFISEMKRSREMYGERTELRWPGTQWMHEMIDRYALVYPTLVTHASGYPEPEKLKQMVKVGNILFEGEMEHDTEGSDFIKRILLDESTEPVYIQIWGGTNTVARALKAIEDEYRSGPRWSEIRSKVSQKAVLYAVLDQDATYRKYVAPHWPEIRVIYNSSQFANFAYPWPLVVPKELQPYLRGQWFRENIKFNHGPLLSSYYLWGDGTKILNDFDHTHGDTATLKKNNMTQYDFISEGDSPAFLHLLDVGLDNLDHPEYGGWGGRMVQSKTNPNRWEDGEHVTDFNPFTQKEDKAFPQTRWIDVIQNDFAARADWCVMPYDKANHAPVLKWDEPGTLQAKAGSSVLLKASATDPDRHSVIYRWWQYFEVDTYPGRALIKKQSQPDTEVYIPEDAKPGETVHIILEVNDSGTPSLTRYLRAVITVVE